MRILFILLTLLTSFFCAGKETVTFGAIVFPPNTVYNARTKECIGDSIRETRRILHQYQFKMDVVCASAIRIYKLIETGEVDITINVKSTHALKQNVTFVDTPYQPLFLVLYTHKNIASQKIVSGIRGFDYHGQRQQMQAQGFEFVDLPNTLSALQVFLKKRSSHLISYRGPVSYYLRNLNTAFDEPVTVTPLFNVNTFYAIGKKSEHVVRLKEVLNDYAIKHNLQYFRKEVGVIPQPHS